MSDPIQQEYIETMRDLASRLDTILNGDERPRELAFVLLISRFGQIDGGRVNYISNGERADCIAMMKEWIARAEGQYSEGEGHG